jgi:hypothetical protein
MRCDNDVTQSDGGPQRARHADEDHGPGCKFGDGSLREYSSGMVALADQTEHHLAVRAGDPPDLELGAGRMRMSA